MNDERTVKLDRLRYTKNTLSSRFAILAILFDVLYFVSIYRSDVGSYYYNIVVGASIVYNLVFMLLVFLSSEGVKNYKVSYSWLLLALGAIQIVRIFIIPMGARAATVTINRETVAVMGSRQFVSVVVYLCISAVCCFASAIANLIKSRALARHVASLSAKQA